MAHREAARVECVAAELDPAERSWSVDVSVLTDERVAAKARLDPDLIATASMERDFDQGGGGKPLEHDVAASRFVAARIFWMRFLLNQRLLVPDEHVAPG